MNVIVYQLLKVQDEAGVVAGKVQKNPLLFPDFKSSWKVIKICTNIRDRRESQDPPYLLRGGGVGRRRPPPQARERGSQPMVSGRRERGGDVLTSGGRASLAGRSPHFGS